MRINITIFIIILLFTDLIYAYEGDYISEFNYSAYLTKAKGIACSSNYLWLVTGYDLTVHKFTKAGTHISNFSLTAANVTPTDIEYYNNKLYVTDQTEDEVYIYSLSGSLLTSFDTNTSGAVQAVGIAVDGNYIYVLNDNPDGVYIFTMNGVYVKKYSLPSSAPYGATIFQNYLWWVSYNNPLMRKYSKAIQNLNYTFTAKTSAGSSVGGEIGITTDGDYFWVVGLSNDIAYKYEGPRKDIKRPIIIS